MPFKKILCPLDFSTGSQQATRTAIVVGRIDAAQPRVFAEHRAETWDVHRDCAEVRRESLRRPDAAIASAMG